MIASLTGTLASIEVDNDVTCEVVVDVGGVGYLANVSARTAMSIGRVGSPVTLSVFTAMRENSITLYGFQSGEERKLFEVLLSAHGVGPALGLSILSVLSPEALRRAVATGDLDALVLVPGVGRKTAQRLVIDLQARFELLPPMGATTSIVGEVPMDIEVREALVSLGYGIDEIRSVLEHLPSDGSIEELIRDALRELAPRR